MAHLDDLASLMAGDVGQLFVDKECRVSGCTEPAITVDLVVREPRVRIDDTCRGHYVEACRTAGILVRCEVLHPVHAVMDVTGAEVYQGGIVELNPQETRIQLLIDAGIVRLAPAPAAAKAAGGAAKG